MRSSDLYRRIAAQHPAPEWACFEEVADATGVQASRRADAVAMSLWPSRGLIVRGFEIKVSRGDYKREAADPSKAEAIARYCDEWWMVTPEGLIREPETELPPAWGLMVPGKGDGLRVVRKAERTEAAPLSRAFLAAVLRAADKKLREGLAGYVRREDIAGELEKARERGAASVPSEVERIKRNLERAEAALKEFHETTGLDLVDGGWRSEGKTIGLQAKLGAAILGRWGSDFDHLLREFSAAEKTCNGIRKRLTEVIATDEAIARTANREEDR